MKAKDNSFATVPKLVLSAILITYLVVAFLYAKSVPKWNAPDEPGHFNYVKTIAQTWTFPVLKQGDYDFDYLEKIKAAKFPDSMPIDSIRYESHQPPLYYLLASPLLLLSSGFPLDTQVLVLRLFSAMLGALTIIVTFQIARSLFPDDQVLSLAAAAFVAFLPMHVFMNAAIENDSLANLLLSTLLLLLISNRSLDTPKLRSTWLADREEILLGLTLGFALLTKVTAYVGLILVAFAIGWQELVRNRNQSKGHRTDAVRGILGRLLKIYVIAFALSGWWFVRNVVVYGNMDIFGLKTHDLIVVGQPLTGNFDEGAIKHFFSTSFKSFWGVFGWMGVFMDDRIYVILALLSSFAALGVILYLTHIYLNPSQLSLHQKLSLSLLFLAIVLIFAGWFQYNLTYIQAQGRYMFPTIAPIAIFFSLGLREVLSKRNEAIILALLFLGFVLLDLLSLYRFIIPQLR